MVCRVSYVLGRDIRIHGQCVDECPHWSSARPERLVGTNPRVPYQLILIRQTSGERICEYVSHQFVCLGAQSASHMCTECTLRTKNDQRMVLVNVPLARYV